MKPREWGQTDGRTTRRQKHAKNENDLLSAHSLLNVSQHGFLSNKSCLTNLLEFLEYVTDAVEHGKPVDVMYLDFQKAFDKVPHQRLLAKLKAYGISGGY